MKKLGHVKNPLTVIAIFAGFAEVAGTAFLPWLDVSVQQIYVWFLMVFPMYLVTLFFMTLNFNHTVLYAPSDYRDETLFRQLVKAKAEYVDFKLEREVAEATAEVVAENEPVASSEPDTSPSTENEASQEKPDTGMSGKYPSVDVLRKRAEVAQKLALDRYEAESDLLLLRQVSPAGRPDLVFDAATADARSLTVVEVKYTAKGNYPESFLRRTLERVVDYRKTLPVALHPHFKFVLVLVVAEPYEHLSPQLKAKTSRILSDYDVTFELKIYNYDDLKQSLD